MKYLLIATALAFITCCKKTDSLDAELAKLPPITQTGANTFGCLVNGKAVTPNSSCINCPPPLEGGYDPSPNGQFSLRCYFDNGNKSIGFGLDSIFTYKNFIALDSVNKNTRVGIYNGFAPDSCKWVATVFNFKKINGRFNLTKVDIPSRIFSGTFDFTINTQNCGNYEVTNGRFDYKF
jgi:hypothetical protein